MDDTLKSPYSRIAQLEEELRIARNALKLSQKRFQRFMDHSPLLAWIKDGRLRFQYLNASFEKHRGVLSKEALVKLTWNSRLG